MADRTYEIKELQLGEILDHSIALMRKEFKLVFTILCFVLIPVQVLWALVSTAMASQLPENPIEVTPVQGLQMMGGGLVYLLVLGLFALPLTSGALIYGIALRYQERETTPGECFRYGLGMVLPLIGAAILCGLATGIGFMLCIIPGILLTLLWFVYQPVLILERSGVINSFSRSQTLMKGSMMKAFVLGVIMFVLQMAVMLVAGMFDMFELGPMFDVVVGVARGIVTGVFVGFNAVVVTVFYFSERCRVENLDLQLRTQEVAAETGQEETVL